MYTYMLANTFYRVGYTYMPHAQHAMCDISYNDLCQEAARLKGLCLKGSSICFRHGLSNNEMANSQ